MYKFKNIIAVLSIALTVSFVGCTDVITVDLEEVPPQLVVDAWLNNRSDTQTIRLSLSQGYFDNGPVPSVSDAEVALVDPDGKIYEFIYDTDGNYTWIPQSGDSLGVVGDSLYLGIIWNETTFVSASQINRTPPIDSIVVEFRQNELGGPDGHYAQFFARDFLGYGDTYWIKTYKNGVFLNKPFEMNLAWDATFDAGSGSDGLIFIPPIREAVNRVADPEGDDNGDVPPWAVGDEIRVEIHSINPLAFDFLQIARDQMTNGSNTIFAIPLANTQTNILTLDGEEQALGFFCLSAISSRTQVVE